MWWDTSDRLKNPAIRSAKNDNLTLLQLCNNWHLSTGQNSNTAGLCKDQKMEASKTIEHSRKSKIWCIRKKYWSMLYISEWNMFRKNKYIIICYSIRQIIIFITHLYLHHNREHLFSRTTVTKTVNLLISLINLF